MAASGLSLTKSIGPHGHWGFSATFDPIEALRNNTSSAVATTNDTINMLLVDPGDVRHVMCCLSRLHRHYPDTANRPKVNIYLLQSPMELLARNLLLLELLFDFEVPIRQRSNIYLEIYGNAFVQRRTSSYMEILSTRLLNLLSKGRGNLQDLLDFNHLSFKERDQLEQVLRNYDRSVVFDMSSLIDHRRRGLYEDRYDSRAAINDWDYHAAFKKKASIVHIKQYRHWRETGIAFEFGDQQYTEPNKSLMSFTEGTMKTGRDKGIKKEIKGFWGDIVVSPYVGVGIDCAVPTKLAEGLFEVHNKVSC
jgi:dynein assembly factor 3, axonemal